MLTSRMVTEDVHCNKTATGSRIAAMTARAETGQPGGFPGIVENEAGTSDVLLVCEHASCMIPPQWGTLGLTEEQRRAHIAWDPGALGLARGLSARLDAALVHAPVSRLVYDCNRAPDQRGAMAERSEYHDIPGNRDLSEDARALRTEAVYLPFQASLRAAVARRLARRRPTVMVTVHSFTPVWHGVPRAVELGVITDADDRLPRAIVAEAQARTGLRVQLDEPYSAADDVTHTLRVHAAPYGLMNAMLEIRNDLIADAAAETAMAALLAPVIRAALDRLSPAEAA